MSAGPWTLGPILYEHGNHKLYSVEDKPWVIKWKENSEEALEELRAVLMFVCAKQPLRHGVVLPKSPYQLFGTTEKAVWYAMWRYDGVVERNDFCRTHWRILAMNALTFLRDLHRGFRMVHMDIKRTNIFVNRLKVSFHVGDYELVDTVYEKMTRNYPDDVKWYYYAFGAEPNEALYSWRMDLTALGYVLADLTWNSDNSPWTFQEECYSRRDGNPMSAFSEAEVLALRAKEMEGVNATVKHYFHRLQWLIWNNPIPPPDSFYDELVALFQ